jgi:GH25 family lysozyme M1 (1,4-beta-N-acetylmuramidase)
MTLAIPDVSEFQKVVNWAACGAQNPAAIVRVHNSNRPDNYAQPNIAGARAHCSWRGFYQYLTATADPVKAAHAFQATLGPTLPGEVMILDLEAGTGDQRARRQAWLNALHDPIEWTYSGLSFARAHLAGVRVEWLAAYGQSEPTDSHTLWQNTDARRFAGIAAPCDGSIFHGTIADLIALTSPKPDPFSPPRKATMLLIKTASTVYITNGLSKRHVGPSEVPDLMRLTGQTTIPLVAQGTVDAMPDVQ